MRIKTADLIDHALDWMVAKCLGITPVAVRKNYSKGWLLYAHSNATVPLEYSSKWSQSGPIIDEMMKGEFFFMENDGNDNCHVAYGTTAHSNFHGYGSTPPIAACRCFVASRLGDEVDVPEELL